MAVGAVAPIAIAGRRDPWHRSPPRLDREGAPTPTLEAARSVRCGDCGEAFELSARNVRAARTQGRELRCRACPGAPAKTEADARMRRYWLERFTLDEIRELAGAIWPDMR